MTLKVLNIFNNLTLNKNSEKLNPCFKKLEYRFLFESTKIKNTTFPYKTVLPEASVMTNRMVEYKMDLSQKTEF